MRLRDLLVIAGLCAGAEASAAPVVVLRWEPMPGAKSYELQVASEPAFSAPIIATTSDVSTYEWKTLPDRVYYWRVRCRYSFGRMSEWSAVRTIPRAVYPVTLASPKPDEEIVCEEGCRVRLVFRKSPALAVYRVELTTDADREFLVPSVDQRVTDGDYVEWTPEETGAYRWRVSAVDLLGRTVAPAGSTRVVITRPAPPVVVAAPTPVPTAIAAPPVTELVGAPVGELAVLADTPLAEPAVPVTETDTAAVVESGPPMMEPLAVAAIESPALTTPARVPVVREPATVTVGAGWRSNFARAKDVTPVVSVSQHVTRNASAGILFSTFRAHASGAHAGVMDVSFHAGLGKSRDSLDLSFRAGPVLQVVRARVGDAAEVGVTGGVGGGLQLGGPLGSARWSLSADVRSGRWEGRHAKLTTGGVLIAAGVRFR